jgi:hypothetical protein
MFEKDCKNCVKNLIFSVFRRKNEKIGDLKIGMVGFVKC